MITTVLFDLDGTLLPMDTDEFTKYYFGLLCKKLAPYGYTADTMIPAIWKGIEAMVKNDGSQSNEAAFWDAFSAILGPQVRDDIPLFEEFYRNEFHGAKIVCDYSQALVDLVHELNEKGYRVILATNPIFPAVATDSRMEWAGLTKDDFELVTTYENCGYSKPNPAYYEDILKRQGLTAAECVMVGNDATEDVAAQKAGIPVFLLTDYLLNKHNVDISSIPHGDVTALRKFLFETS